MSQTPTVLILGAGSNVPFGFPSGAQLTKSIIKGLSSAHKSSLSVRMRRYFQPREIEVFRKELIASQCESIDRFLQFRTEYANIGRHAIAISILLCEHETHGADFDYGATVPKMFRIGENWYAHLLNRLGNTPEAVREQNLRIVTFNYDRSLEFYLLTGLKHRYQLSDGDASATIEPLQITHVYGSVAELHGGNEHGTLVPYGKGSEGSVDYTACAQRIRVVDSRDDDSTEFVIARKSIMQSEKIVFLGFGYDDINLRRLLSFRANATQSVIGTAFEFTNQEVFDAVNRIRENIAVNYCQLNNTDGQSDVLSFMRHNGLLTSRAYTNAQTFPRIEPFPPNR